MYYVQLQLTPTSDGLLPRSYLNDLTDEQREDHVAWFDAQGAPTDVFDMYSKVVSIENTEYVEELVVRVGKKKYPLSLSRETKTIQNAIDKPWAIRLKGKVFQFSVKFYRYTWFVPTFVGTQRENVLNHLGGEALLYEDAAPEEWYEQVALSIPSGDLLSLKKTNFCNRVRLTRLEWIAGFQEIRLNTSREVFDSKKLLGDSEFDIFLDDLGEPTVDICVDDFNPDYQEHQASRNKASQFSSGMVMVTVVLLLLQRRSVRVLFR